MTAPTSIFEKLFERLFATDLRTLGLFRILLAACALIDLATRLPLAHAITGADGVLPAAPAERFVLHSWAPALLWEPPLVAVSFLAFLALLLGWKTKVFGPIAWLLLLGLHTRNPSVLDGGDRVLLQLHLWGLLLPWGDRFSLDSRSSEPRRSLLDDLARRGTISSFSSAGLRLQVVLVYLLSAVYKLKTSDWRDGIAAGYALGESLWARPLGAWIADHPEVARWTTYSTLIIEIVAPLLLVSPLKTRRARAIAVVFLICLQIGIGMSLRMNLFPWIMTLALIPYLPADAWNHCKTSRSAPSHSPPRSDSLPTLLNQVLGITLLTLVFLSSVTHLTSRLDLPPPVAVLERELGFGQRWSMYAPPFHQEFGLEIIAERIDGSRAVLSQGRGSVDVPSLDKLWKDYRGGMYLERLSRGKDIHALQDFARWLVQVQEKSDPSRTIARIHFTRLTWERAHPTIVERTHLLTWER